MKSCYVSACAILLVGLLLGCQKVIESDSNSSNVLKNRQARVASGYNVSYNLTSSDGATSPNGCVSYPVKESEGFRKLVTLSVNNFGTGTVFVNLRLVGYQSAHGSVCSDYQYVGVTGTTYVPQDQTNGYTWGFYIAPNASASMQFYVIMNDPNNGSCETNWVVNMLNPVSQTGACSNGQNDGANFVKVYGQ